MRTLNNLGSGRKLKSNSKHRLEAVPHLTLFNLVQNSDFARIKHKIYKNFLIYFLISKILLNSIYYIKVCFITSVLNAHLFLKTLTNVF